MPHPINPAQGRARKLRAWDYASNGNTLAWIANQLERDGLGRVSIPAVWKMVHCQETVILSRLTRRAEMQKCLQTEQLRLIFRESLESWEWSRINDKGKKQQGDTLYLFAALKALSGIRKLWGLEVNKQEPSRAANKAETELERFLRARKETEAKADSVLSKATPQDVHA